MKKLAILTVATLGLASFGVAGGFAAESGTDDFTHADANNDGVVSMNEAMGIYPTLTSIIFDQADSNKDGNLDEGEYGLLQGLSAGLDTNDNDNGNGSAADEGGSSNGDNGGSSNGDNGGSSNGDNGGSSDGDNGGGSSAS